MINYLELKAAMADKGFPVSAGDQWTRQDEANYRQFCYHNHNDLVPNRDLMALAYPGIAPEGFPGTEPVVEKTLVLLEIVGQDEVEEGQELALIALGTYDDESTADLTADAVWESDDQLVATVDAGLVTGLATGQANITATVGEIESEPHTVTVTEAVVEDPEEDGPPEGEEGPEEDGPVDPEEF